MGFAVVLGPLVFIHELGHFVAARWAGICVLEFGLGFPPRMVKLGQDKDGAIYSINWLLPLGGFVRMLGEEDPSAPRSFAAASKRWRSVTLLAGSLMNILLAWVLLTIAWMTGLQEAATCRYQVVNTRANSAAAAAGIWPDDVIVSVNGEPMDGCDELSGYLRARAGQTVSVEIERAGRRLALPLALRAPGQYDQAIEGPSGLYFKRHPLTWTIHRSGLGEAMFKSAELIVTMAGRMLSLPTMLLGGLKLSSFMGPIGISQAGSEALQTSLQSGVLFPILSLIGQVSVAVGLTNLLPFPALDGGRLVFVLVEWVRNKRLDPRKEKQIHLGGLGLLLILMALISYTDIARLLSGQRIF